LLKEALCIAGILEDAEGLIGARVEVRRRDGVWGGARPLLRGRPSLDHTLLN